MSNIIELKTGAPPTTIKLHVPLKLGFPQAPPAKKPTFYSKTRWRTKSFFKKLFKKFIKPARDRRYRRKAQRLIADLMGLAIKLNRPDFHVFVNYSGHIDCLSVDVCMGGYVSPDDKKKFGGNKVVILNNVYVPGTFQSEYSTSTPNDIRTAMQALKALSKLNKFKR